MRHLILAAASTACLLAGLSAFSPAAAESRYCLQGRIWGYPGNCQFATYEQCQASASGTNAYCGINPRYAYGQQRGYRRYPAPYPRY
ncbi:DUF3551 domain-containing protein [Bradyrhizobium sp. STM 3557]|uniref:DUF3551 domain-containing protein n=1 Tax=Bradyrhizobium sp. STM 3557 TaxID=578920 RepID=UPI0038901492